MNFLRELHEFEVFIKLLNNSLISQIQKFDRIIDLHDFKPILLVGCSYNILIKFW